MMTDEGAPGFFGKIPVVGDFVSRRLPRSFIAPWDTWLQEAIVYSRDQLQETWLETYLYSPIWRFVLAGGVAGSLPCHGIVMPSVDKAGRYFPITVVSFLPANINPFEIVSGDQGWFDSAEDVALSVLAENPPDIDVLDKNIIALGQPYESCSDDVGAASLSDIPSEQKLMCINLPSIGATHKAALMLTKRMAELQYGAYSLWWSSAEEDAGSALIVCEGLPTEQASVSMLLNNWRGAESERPAVGSGS